LNGLNWLYTECLPKERRSDPSLKARYDMARLVAYTFASEDPYRALTEEEEKTKLPADKLAMTPLVHWNQSQWEALDDMLHDICKNCGGKNPTDPWFKSKFTLLTNDYVMLHLLLSKIRFKLEHPFHKKDPEEEDAEILPEELNEFFDLVDSETGEEQFEKCRAQLHGLVGPTKDGQEGERSLRSRSQLVDILREKHFDLRYFRKVLVKFFLNWSKLAKFEEILGEGEMFSESENQDTVRASTVRRKSKNNSRQASGATSHERRPRSPSRRGLKRIRQVEVAPRDDHSQPRIDFHTRRRKKRWTEEEREAVIQGVRKFGPGSWSKIKNEYDRILADRSSVNIKDCYRTLVKQGIIDE